jgi:hypothetical protein
MSDNQQPEHNPLTAFKAQAKNNRRQRQDQLSDGIYRAVSIRTAVTNTHGHWDITIWFDLSDFIATISEYYSPTGPKVRQLEKAFGIKISDLESEEQLVGRHCRLRLRRNAGYPRYKVLEILTPEEPDPGPQLPSKTAPEH